MGSDMRHCVLTLVERKTGYAIIKRLANKDHVTRAATRANTIETNQRCTCSLNLRGQTAGGAGRQEIDSVHGSIEACPRQQRIGGHGLREEEALQLIAPKFHQDVTLFCRFDTFGNYVQTQGVGQANHGIDDSTRIAVDFKVHDEAAVDLELLRW